MLSLVLVLAVSYSGPEIKVLVMIYAIWLILKKDAGALPALAVIISFLSNSYVIYFAMMALAILNYNEIRNYRVHKLLLVLLIFLPLVIFRSFSNIIVLNLKPGLVLNQFELYFSMFSFFYGVLILKTFNKKVMKALILTFCILYLSNFLKVINSDFMLLRLTFYIIPFSAGCLSFFLFNKSRKSFVYLSICMTILWHSVIFTASTFTIYLTSLFTLILSFFYYKRMNAILLRTTGVLAFIVVFLLMAYAITGFRENDYSQLRVMSMSDITSIESLTNRIKMKLFDDRAPLWVGTWNEIIHSKDLWPPQKVKEIQTVRRTGKGIEFEFHSHNIYLELMRTNGIIMGAAVSIILIFFSLSGRKVFSVQNIDPLFIVFIATSISTIIIGAFTGIYILLSAYAGFGLTIVGVAFATYKINTQSVKTYTPPKKILFIRSLNPQFKSTPLL